MVDATTLIVIATLAQTVVITITLMVFILQFRSQEKSIRESSYQGLMGRYNDSMQALVGSPALSKMLAARMGDESGEISETQAAIYGHLLIVYGIIEEAFLLYKKGWIDERNWLQWSAFLEALAKNPEFALIHANSSGTFDGDFEDYVAKLLAKRADGRA